MRKHGFRITATRKFAGRFARLQKKLDGNKRTRRLSNGHKTIFRNTV